MYQKEKRTHPYVPTRILQVTMIQQFLQFLQDHVSPKV